MTMGIVGFQQEPVRNDSVTIGTSNTEIARSRIADAPRKVISIRNISNDPTKIITISFGLTTATANKGIVLRQYESFTDSNDGQYECYQGQINGICAVADGTVSIMER